MGAHSRRSQSSSSVYSGSSGSSSGWSHHSGLSDISEKGTTIRYKDVGKLNGAQKFMAWTLGIKVDKKKRHAIRAEMLEWQGVDHEGRIVTWFDDAQIFWTTHGGYEDERRRPRSKASSRSHKSGRQHGPQGRPMPPPQIRPPGGQPFQGGGGGPRPFMPGPGGPPPPPQHFHPAQGGPPPMQPPPMQPPQGRQWQPPPPAVHEEFDEPWSGSGSGYDDSDDGHSYQQSGGAFMGGPPPGQFPGGPPPPLPPQMAEKFDNGVPFVKL